MERNLPFYMAYEAGYFKEKNNVQNDRWTKEWQHRRDYDYMKSIYPDAAKRVLPYIEKECDKMEYTGSMMFDEYPDLLQLRLICRRIYDKVKESEPDAGGWLMDLIQVMTYQEILKRRNEYRNYTRKYF